MTTQAQAARHKGKFLMHFAEFGNITSAAYAAGVDRRTIYKWQETDDQFAAAFREADIQATEVLEAEARRRAVVGVESKKGVYDRQGNLVAEETETKYSDTLLIFLLKARNPAKYRENRSIEISGPDGGPIQTEELSISDADRAKRIAAVLERARGRTDRPADGAESDLAAVTGPAN